MTKPSPQYEPQKPPNSLVLATNNGIAMRSEEMDTWSLGKRPMVVSEQEANWVVKKVQAETTQQFKPLEDDHIEQMIEELLDYGSIELCSVVPQAL